MPETHYVTHIETLHIQKPGIARLLFSVEDAPQQRDGDQPPRAVVRQPALGLAMPVQGLLELHGLLTKALIDLEKQGLLRRTDAEQPTVPGTA